MESAYHVPVLLRESLQQLAIQPAGTYIDLTFGGGGHSAAILALLNEQGQLYAFDQDEAARANAQAFTHPGFHFIQANFRYLEKYLKMYKVAQVEGILADLGVSSHQFDTPDRGFSIRFEATLDMRMNQNTSLTAKEVINTYTTLQLHQILGKYGEVRNAKTLAEAIVRERKKKAITTVNILKEIVTPFAPKKQLFKYLAQVFQAIRIEVNDEMKALEEALVQSAALLKTGGRLVVITYHSLEDRLVKNFIQKGKFIGEVEKDLYGNVLKPLEAVIRKPLLPTEAEITENPRARSAKLRVAVKR
ncbi:MAG: 16S rRNA (cytosine(1402)-N(4))-methyltransferase RsmH [Thermonemataceae bacterium]